MLEIIHEEWQTHISEVIVITNDPSPHADAFDKADLLALNADNGIPHPASVKHAAKILDRLLHAPPRTISCVYKLDDMNFNKMRASLLLAGMVALLVQAGYHAIVAPVSSHLPTAHWRSEFIFRAVRGIRLLKPELSSEQVFFIVTQAIHFYTPDKALADDLDDGKWHKLVQQYDQIA